MSQFKHFILAFLLLISSNIISQDNVAKDVQALNQKIAFHIGQAELDLERSNWYIAEDNLQKALDFAKKIDDKRNIGIINTKIAKIKYKS